jgi:hypothetical protein
MTNRKDASSLYEPRIKLTRKQALAWVSWHMDTKDPFEAAHYMGIGSGNAPRKKEEWDYLVQRISVEYSSHSGKHGPPVFHDFYMSPEWQRVRYSALLKSDGLCCLCGRDPITHGVALHVDHIVPRSKNRERELDESNLQVLCEDCNLGKGNRDETDWRHRK